MLGTAIIEELSSLVFSARNSLISGSLVAKLTSHGVPIIYCNSKYMPSAITIPLSANGSSASILREQISASKPLQKNLWRQIVQRKIRNQSQVLESLNKSGKGVLQYFERLERDVRSGDSTNREAVAAKTNWKYLMGNGFRRNYNNDDALNAALNYGYTVLRGACARSVVSAGLHPALGIHHSSQRNPFQLVDDLMEVFRPFVDQVVASNSKELTKVDRNAKQRLAKVLQLSVLLDGQRVPVTQAMNVLSFSLVKSLRNNISHLEMPVFLLPESGDTL